MPLTSEKIRRGKEPRYAAVANSLRSIISSSKGGQMLSSERDLAKQYSVSSTTVRKVLGMLEQEGRVQRYHGRGTVIVDPLQQGEFAVVLSPSVPGTTRSPYYQITAHAINAFVQKEKQRDWQVKIHLGVPWLSAHNFPATLDLLHPDVIKRLRGVFTFHPLFEVSRALAESKIPVVMLGPGGDYGVSVDMQSFYDQAVKHLRQVGCRSIGFIWYGEEKNGRLIADLRPEFRNYAKTAGLETKTEWMPYYVAYHYEKDGKAGQEVGYNFDSGGFEAFNRLWEQPDRPDGVVVIDEILCQGVMKAAWKLGVKMPEELRLVSYGNIGVDIPYIEPITQVSFDPSEIAQKAVEMMMKLIRGREPEEKQIRLPGKLIRGQTT